MAGRWSDLLHDGRRNHWRHVVRLARSRCRRLAYEHPCRRTHDFGGGLSLRPPSCHQSAFAFGTGKLGDLAGYTSAVVLGMIALLIAYQSIERLLHPVVIAYGEAIAIASLGLAVNMVSAWLLRGSDHHDHDDHNHHGHDLNLRSAYVHVLADAVTSLLAISGLSLAWTFSWRFIDPLVGLAGTVVIG